MASSSRVRTNKHKSVKIKEEDFPDPIILFSSDEEEVREPSPRRHKAARPRINFMWDWKKEVTHAVANMDKKQTLHVPAFIVSKFLRNKDGVFVRSEETQNAYWCDLLKPVERGENVRYLGDGWYDYLEDHMPELGDVMLFHIEGSPKTIVVKLLREKDRGRR